MRYSHAKGTAGALAALLVGALAAGLVCTPQAWAADASQKPSRAESDAAFRALDAIEDALILGKPTPAFDPALGHRRARVTLSTPDLVVEGGWPWEKRAVGSVRIAMKVTGMATGPLTVWAMAGGHACVPGTKSPWQRWTVRKGDDIIFPLKDRTYSTYVFLRVSDSRGRFRYAHTVVPVASRADADEMAQGAW